MVHQSPFAAAMQQPPPAHVRNFNLAQKALWNAAFNYGNYLSDPYSQFSQWPNPYSLQSPTNFRSPYPSLPGGAFSGFGSAPFVGTHAPLTGHSFSPASFLSGQNSPAPSGTSLNGGSGSSSSSGTKSSNSRKLGSIKQEPLDDPNNNITRSLTNPNSPSSSSVSSLKHRNTTEPSHGSTSKKLKASSNGHSKSLSSSSLGHIQPPTPGSVSLTAPSTPGSDLSKQQTQSNLNIVANHNNNQPHIKKPLNAFMIYMKEMRPKVIEESTLKESAAINQILGKRVSFSIRIFC